MSKKPKETGAGVILAILLMPVAWVTKAAAIQALWIWFLVPVGVPAIGYAHALGIGALASLLTESVSGIPKDRLVDDFPAWGKNITFIVAYGFVWGVGWLCHTASVSWGW